MKLGTYIFALSLIIGLNSWDNLRFGLTNIKTEYKLNIGDETNNFHVNIVEDDNSNGSFLFGEEDTEPERILHLGAKTLKRPGCNLNRLLLPSYKKACLKDIILFETDSSPPFIA